MKLVILLPALNEELTIGAVVKSIPRQFDGISEVVVLVINDGSKDKTAELAKNAGAVVVSHKNNRGVGSAFRTGLNASLEMGADILVNIDADGQFSPIDIPLLINPILNNQADFVSGDRFSDEFGNLRKPKYMSPIKYWGNLQMASLISVLSDIKFYDVSCGFRAYSKEAMIRLNLTGKFTYTQESFLDLSYKGVEIKSVPVEVKYFPERESRVANSLIRYMLQTIKIILRVYRDYKPAQFFGILGLFPFTGGLFCSLFVFIHFLNTQAFTPYKAVGFIGIYLVTLGILFWIVGLLADMFVRMRLNQEQILYYEKKQLFDK
jgi:glycosyltransferase involved in cell wall biosynthesis